MAVAVAGVDAQGEMTPTHENVRRWHAPAETRGKIRHRHLRVVFAPQVNHTKWNDSCRALTHHQVVEQEKEKSHWALCYVIRETSLRTFDEKKKTA